jgi:hypothetical protein
MVPEGIAPIVREARRKKVCRKAIHPDKRLRVWGLTVNEGGGTGTRNVRKSKVGREFAFERDQNQVTSTFYFGNNARDPISDVTR